MTRKHVGLTALALLLAVVAAKALVYAKVEMEKDAIKSLIEAAYINGAFNDLDTESMRDGFHPAFKIHGVQDGSLREYPLNEWIENTEKRKTNPDFDPANEKWDHNFVLVDVTGVAAMAKIELFKDSKHVYTDYLSLLKFGDGWKITDKVYHRHTDTD